MSIANDNTDGDGGGVALESLGIVKPTLQHPQGPDRGEVQPLICDLSRFQFNWEKASLTTLGGETVTQNGPPQPARVTIEGIIGDSQLEALIALMQRTRRVRLITEALTQTVAFDTFQVEQNESLNTGTYTYEGERVTEPLYEFQIQHKEDTDENGGLFG